MSVQWLFEADISLIFALSNDLYQLFEPSRDIVCIRKLLVLPLNKLCLVEAQVRVLPHGIISGVSILVRAV
jgi:hypothetical protein